MKGFERDQMFLEEGKRQERENTLREKNRADAKKRRAEEERQRAGCGRGRNREAEETVGRVTKAIVRRI